MIRAVRGGVALVLLIGLLALNLATILIPAVHDALRSAAAAVLDVPDGSRRSDAEADLEAERTRSRTLAADLETERARARRLAIDVEGERAARAALQADFDALRRQSDEAVAAVDELSGRILRRAARGAVRAPSVLVASAIPLAGTGIDLAATAIDLTDACDMARDMTALRAELNLAETAEVGPICAAVGGLPSLNDILNPPEVISCTAILEGTGIDQEHCVRPPPPGGPEAGDPPLPITLPPLPPLPPLP